MSRENDRVRASNERLAQESRAFESNFSESEAQRMAVIEKLQKSESVIEEKMLILRELEKRITDLKRQVSLNEKAMEEKGARVAQAERETEEVGRKNAELERKLSDRQKAIIDLERHIEELERLSNDKTMRLVELETDLEFASGEMIRMSEERKQTEQKQQSNESDIQKLKWQNEELEGSLRVLKEERNRIKREGDESKNEAKAMKNDLRSMEFKIDELLGEIESLRSLNDTLKAERQRLADMKEQKQHEFEQESQRLRSERHALEDNLKAMKDDFSLLTREKNEREIIIMKMETESRGMSEKMNSLISQGNRERQEMENTLQSIQSKYEARLRDAESQVEMLKSELALTNTALFEYKSARDEVERRLKEVVAEQKKREGKIVDTERFNDELEKKLKEISNELKKAINKIFELENRLRDSEEETNKYQLLFNDSKRDYDGVKSKLGNLLAEKEAIKEKCAAAEYEADSSKRELQRLTIESKHQAQKLQDLERKYTLVENTNRELLDIEKRYKHGALEFESLQKEYSRVKELLAKSEATVQDLRIENSELKKEVSDLKEIYDRWQAQRDQLVLAMQKEQMIA